MPSRTYQAAGPASLLAWAGLLALSVPVALTFAELGAQLPDAGGLSTAVTRAFGPRAGALCGFWFVLAVPIGAPAAALVGGAYVARAAGLPTAAGGICALALLGAALASTLTGVRVAGSIQLVLIGVLVAVLLVASLGAAPAATSAHLTPFAPHGAGGVMAALGILFFSFAGWEAVAPLAQDFADPERDVRAVTRVTLALVAGTYLLLALASILVLGPALDHGATPVQQLLEVRFGAWSGTVTGGLAAVLTYGAMTSYLTGAARMASALARDAWLPAPLAAGHASGNTPRRAAVTIGVAAIAVLLTTVVMDLDLGRLLALGSAMFLAVTMAGLAAGGRLLRTRPGRRRAVGAALVMGAVLVGTGWAAIYPLVVAACVLGIRSRRKEMA
jgi:amino acid efflux transporter